MFKDIFLTILELFLMIAIGFGASKLGYLKEKASQALTDFLFCIATPCMILETMQQQDFTGSIANDILWSFLCYTIVTLLLCLVSFPASKAFRVPESDEGVYRIQIAFTNFGFMGIPLTKAMFGGYCELLIVVMNTAFIIIIYSIGVFTILYEPGRRSLDRSMMRKMINPPLVCSIIGLVMFISGLRFPAFVVDGLGLVGDTVVPVSMAVIGIQMCGSDIRKLLTRRNLYLCLFSLILVPVFTLGICLLLPAGDPVSLTLTFGMAMPSAAITVVLSEQFGKNTRLASEGIVITTFFSLITLPLWAIALTWALL